MKKMARGGVEIASSPHIHRGVTTAKIMWSVTLCLLPASAWGVFVFGLPALRVLLTAIAASVLTELAISSLLKRLSIADGSAALTGLLVGLTMPPSAPVYVPVVASVFAVGVAKWAFGGLGANWVNPALAGRLLVLFAWPELLSRWDTPRLWVSGVGASPAPLASLARQASGGVGGGSFTAMAARIPPGSALDRIVGTALDRLLGSHGALPEGLLDLLVGNRAGAIGELSAILLLAGAAYLFARRMIAWEIPVSMLGTVALLAWIFGGRRAGLPAVAFQLLGGGLMLGAFFMATDPVTSPLSPFGMVIFGIGCGALTYLVRSLGVYPEGVAFGIVLMNMLVPAINRLTHRRGRDRRARVREVRR